MVLEYAAEFEKSVKEQLQRNDKHKDQRDRIIFVRSPAAALRILTGEIKFQKGAEFVRR
jgi:hypothetical protein